MVYQFVAGRALLSAILQTIREEPNGKGFRSGLLVNSRCPRVKEGQNPRSRSRSETWSRGSNRRLKCLGRLNSEFSFVNAFSAGGEQHVEGFASERQV